ncbi:hypothetical protein [Endozoicomonas sp. GU-1]|uniref:hypothetical protein n=1 Tax=Endozoicomonas sp. GU-1 TaxID=3009078 RepID=UPI0022B45601|nr:hypothetical protein [Endozoicomonas sp. GU-1]WBA79570.1 hypothetical protein O2T12_14395 [Endozoicomonas sp. GU-1]
MSYYHNTKQALLSAFDLRGVKCKGMQFNYDQDYPTVNRFTTEPSTFDERLAQDAMVRRSIREAMTEEEYLTLMFCYTQDGNQLKESYSKAVYPVAVKSSRLAQRLKPGLLLSWLFHAFSQTKRNNTAPDLTEILGVNRSTIYRSLKKPLREALRLEELEDRVSQILHDKGWYIGTEVTT